MLETLSCLGGFRGSRASAISYLANEKLGKEGKYFHITISADRAGQDVRQRKYFIAVFQGHGYFETTGKKREEIVVSILVFLWIDRYAVDNQRYCNMRRHE